MIHIRRSGAMKVYCNIEARSRNHFYSGKQQVVHSENMSLQP